MTTAIQTFCRCIGLGSLFSSNGNRDLNYPRAENISPAAEQRVREAETMAWNARLTWVIIHVVFVSFVTMLDSQLARAIALDNYWYSLSYFGLVVITVLMYYVTCVSSPGYVYEIQSIIVPEDINEDLTSSTNLQPCSSFSSPETKVNMTRNDFSCEETPLLCEKSGSNTSSANSSSNSVRSTLISHSSFNILPIYERNLLKKCPYCSNYQPLRAKHCHDCNKCVLKFDHHCYWLGRCIGLKNHRIFWLFLLFESILGSWTFVLTLSSFSSQIDVYAWIEFNIFPLLVIIPLSITCGFIFSLLFFHTYLAVTNQTTYEFTRKKRISYLRDLPSDAHPFSTGFVQNVISFCSANYPIYANEVSHPHQHIPPLPLPSPSPFHDATTV